MALTLKKLWEPSPEVSLLMQEAIRVAKAAVEKTEGTLDKVMVLNSIRDCLNEEMNKAIEEAIQK